MLIALTLFGVYSWVPLVWGWMGGESSDESAESTPATDLSMTVAVVPTDQNSGDVEPDGQWDWRSQAENIDQERQTKTSQLDGELRNPFGLNEPAGDLADAEAQNEEPRGPRRPAEVGLVLSSTIVGQSRRVAMINGRAYTEGRSVEASSGEQFVLEEIWPRRVVLQRGGERFNLRLKERQRAAAPKPSPVAAEDDA